MPTVAVDQPEPLDILLNSAMPVEGQFTQKKYFKILKNPVISSGTFSASDEGFNWQIIKPVHSAVILQGQDLWLVNSRGERESQPNAYGFITILKSILIGDKKTIRKHFDVLSSAKTSCTSLEPMQAQMKKILSRLEICQQANGYEIELLDSNEVRTVIDLTIPSDA